MTEKSLKQGGGDKSDFDEKNMIKVTFGARVGGSASDQG
jgi:hypothetical protein